MAAQVKPEQSPQPADFETLIETHQAALRGFILSLVADPSTAEDILQETNLVAWRKAADFETGSNFRAWAFRIAHFQVLRHRQKLSRDRLILDDDLVNTLADEAVEDDQSPIQARRERLNLCLARLPERQRAVITSRYFEDESVAKIAARSGTNANAVSQLLHRARRNLLECLGN
jgi:RNA polymerase sigma-70 factor (ECF subfamily)